MKLKQRSINTFILAIFAPLLGVSGVLAHSQTVSAAPINDFNAGNIIDDGVFYNKSAMNVQQIQSFLNGLITNCDTWGTGRSEYGGGTRAQYAASVGWPAPPYACLNNYHENPANNETSYERGGGAFPGGLSAAQIIYNAAQEYGINPQVLLVMLKKESAGPLTADTWPLKSQYKYAMGYACPDSGPGYSANCQASKAGFYNQMMTAAWQLKYYKEHPNDYRYAIGPNQIQYAPDPACGTKSVYIENMATLSLYIYTPYTPNNGALANYPGTAPCGAYGNRNFFMFFKEWFGSTYSFVNAGVNYSTVFDPQFYLAKYPDLNAAFGADYMGAFRHFLSAGMKEGRQGSSVFDVTSYKNRYPDLRVAYENNLQNYYLHFLLIGFREGRVATGDIAPAPITSLNGIEYSSIYSYSNYTSRYSDLNTIFSNNDAGAIKHFVISGMREGRQAADNFSVLTYQARYPDLRRAFGNNLPDYYVHYRNTGINEGRTANGTIHYVGTSIFGGKDYSSVYDFHTYITTYQDLFRHFSTNDSGAIEHFVKDGMNEGRVASPTFNVYKYKDRYPDLRNAFGNNLRAYYLHYIDAGRAEGRIAT